MMTRDAGILVLEKHRNNLANAKTFEEYRDLHVAYVDWLIALERARKSEEDALYVFTCAVKATGEVKGAWIEDSNKESGK